MGYVCDMVDGGLDCLADGLHLVCTINSAGMNIYI